jgi:hypothetical protein
MRARRQVSDLPFGNVKLRAIPIPERRAADNINLAFELDLAHALQLLAQDLDLAGELVFVGRVLVMAAAARREQRAGRYNALRRRREHFDQGGMYVLTRVDPYGFPGQDRRHEHNSAGFLFGRALRR